MIRPLFPLLRIFRLRYKISRKMHILLSRHSPLNCCHSMQVNRTTCCSVHRLHCVAAPLNCRLAKFIAPLRLNTWVFGLTRICRLTRTALDLFPNLSRNYILFCVTLIGTTGKIVAFYSMLIYTLSSYTALSVIFIAILRFGSGLNASTGDAVTLYWVILVATVIFPCTRGYMCYPCVSFSNFVVHCSCLRLFVYVAILCFATTSLLVADLDARLI
jgi:hypothetical protein